MVSKNVRHVLLGELVATVVMVVVAGVDEVGIVVFRAA